MPAAPGIVLPRPGPHALRASLTQPNAVFVKARACLTPPRSAQYIYVWDNKIEVNAPLAICGPATCDDKCIQDSIWTIYCTDTRPHLGEAAARALALSPLGAAGRRRPPAVPRGHVLPHDPGHLLRAARHLRQGAQVLRPRLPRAVLRRPNLLRADQLLRAQDLPLLRPAVLHVLRGEARRWAHARGL